MLQQSESKNPTVHASQDFSEISGGRGQNTNPFAPHRQYAHSVFRVWLQNIN